jgi:glycerol-3-phosphate acyltransferase PlsY
MVVISGIAVLLLAYLIGSIPFGVIIVKLTTGKDIRAVASGRTGGTNAMRAAGVWAGLATAVFDVLKGVGAVFFSHLIFAGLMCWHLSCPLLVTIIQHS